MTHGVIQGPFLIAALVLIAVEAVYIAVVEKRSYDVGQTAVSFGIALGNVVTRPLATFVVALVFPYVAKFAPWHLPMEEAWVWGLGFIAYEFLYYWMHRFSHTIRWLWASHSVHHSSPSFTLPSAIRLGWTNLISGEWLIFLPLMLFGFPPIMVVIFITSDLAYQFFLHTETSPKWGWLEYVFNTPAHHRIHHASNMCYLDKNFGGILIVFDRLFGTFAEDDGVETVRFGLAHTEASMNPFVVALREWGCMFADAARARSPAAVADSLFGRPK